MDISKQNTAAWLLMGALYHKCGFTHPWNRNPGIIDPFPTRYECLVSALPELNKHGIYAEVLKYLVGEISPYWPPKNEYFEEYAMPLKRVAMLLELRSLRDMNKERVRVLRLVWSFLTGAKSYEDIYENKEEKRSLTEQGIYFIDPFGEVDLDDFLEMERTGGAWH